MLETSAGGLVLKPVTGIDTRSENIFLSSEIVRVNYVFRNRGGQDRSAVVAFPMPDRNLFFEGELNSEADDHISHIRDLVITVNGLQAQLKVERKATHGPHDYTALLTRLGIPLAPPIDAVRGPEHPVYLAWQRLRASDKAHLKRLNLISDGLGGGLAAHWQFEETYSWTQTFPAGRDVRVELQYRPAIGFGTSAGHSSLFDPDGRGLRGQYCLKTASLRAVDRMLAAGGQNSPLAQTKINYILRPGRAPRRPIRQFRLVVDKGRAENIVSFCGGVVRRIGPTQYEMRRTNWRPDYDLQVLILSPAPPSS
jgi:hypothetical protein